MQSQPTISTNQRGLLSKWLPKALLTDTLLEERSGPTKLPHLFKICAPLMGPRATNLASGNPEPLTSTDGGHIRVRFPLPVLGSLRESSTALGQQRFPKTCNRVPSLMTTERPRLHCWWVGSVLFGRETTLAAGTTVTQGLGVVFPRCQDWRAWRQPLPSDKGWPPNI